MMMKLIFALFFSFSGVVSVNLATSMNDELSSTICQSGVEPIIDGFLDRKVKKKPVVFIDQKGTIATKICINSKGIVTYVELNNKETTIKEKAVLKSVLQATRKFEFDRKSVKEQCGTITYVLP
jgi:hypothetical protein